ncbi:MAG: glutamyl-tRNA reductase [Sandaracinaceae bacterium]|nr:glutamyl-tRNA reductase [Sandaracinaceae bacterium]
MSDELFVLGLSHHTAKVEQRERLSTSIQSVGEELRRLLESEEIREAVLVSTCNRVELYALSSPAGVEKARSYLLNRGGDDLLPHLYEKRSRDAVHHTFRVASSLDSLVVGEPQILGQLKEAFDAATEVKAVGPFLSRLFTSGFAAAKRVRSETAIAEGTVSVSSIACELAEKIFGQLEGRRALLIGAGEMGESAAKTLAKTGASLVILNRSVERAEALARQIDGAGRSLDALVEELLKADVVISSAASHGYLLDEHLMRDVIRARRHRPLFLIDIAVPRNIDPRVGDYDGVFLYDVDDLKSVADENLAKRRRETLAAEKILEEEVESFLEWKRGLSVKPTIIALRSRFERIVRDELSRTLPRLSSVSEEDRKLLERMSASIVNKLLHPPLKELKDGAEDPALLEAVHRLFALQVEGNDEGEEDGESVSEPKKSGAFAALQRLRIASSEGDHG